MGNLDKWVNFATCIFIAIQTNLFNGEVGKGRSKRFSIIYPYRITSIFEGFIPYFHLKLQNCANLCVITWFIRNQRMIKFNQIYHDHT